MVKTDDYLCKNYVILRMIKTKTFYFLSLKRYRLFIEKNVT